MTDFLEKVLAAHGGLDNWSRVNTIDFRLTLRGRALEVKQQPNGLRDVLVKIDVRRPRTLITPYPTPGSRGIFDDGRVRIETSAGVRTSALDEPRQSFAGHEPQTPWSESQLLYFIGYALHNYMTMPFLLARDGVQCEEIAAHEENGERWRVLSVTFPSDMHVHCREQKFYFNDAGYLVRNDYAPDVSRGSAAHYTFDHASFDGFVFPTHRRVVFRDASGRTHLAGPSIFRLDIESIVVS
ncbi:hypothetical protein [Paraburkholderia sp. ZP32-5]|uniref:hypothetical protein n=1 Tax=Paraburkholderia sp. ZP32-5 TaxID=2883245 RepID=UPI001F246421|nr:hypothetical protein [Paraburkholderia sp. ZP32-5]